MHLLNMNSLCIVLFTINLLPLTQASCIVRTFNDIEIKMCSDVLEKNCDKQKINMCLNSENLPPNITTVRILDNVPKLNEKAFMNLQNLEIILIEYVDLQIIQANAFMDTPKVNKINLTGNRMKKISYGIFNNQSLSELVLTKNQIKHIDEKAFADMPKLVYMDLNQNKLNFFNKEWFSGDSRLEDLSLNHNLIASLKPGAFKTFKHLRSLSLRGNLLKTIEAQVFYGMQKTIESVDISFNQIEFIDPNAFVSGTSIAYLKVYLNQLKFLSSRLLKNINFEQLHVHPNPWICECLAEIYDSVYSVRRKGSCIGDQFNDGLLAWSDLYPVCVAFERNDSNFCSQEFVNTIKDDPIFEDYFDITDYDNIYIGLKNHILVSNIYYVPFKFVSL